MGNSMLKNMKANKRNEEQQDDVDVLKKKKKKKKNKNKNKNINQLQQQTPSIDTSGIKQMLAMVKGVKDPSALFNMLAQQNPMVAQALQLAQGGNPMQIAEGMANKLGINFNDLKNQLL